jgi:uncharacterized protein YkwD
VAAKVQPINEAVPRYGAPVEHALSEGEQSLAKALTGASLVHDPALSRMVRSLALQTPSRFDMPPDLVDGLLAWNGVVDPPPSVVVIELPEDPEGCSARADGACSGVYGALVEEVERGAADRKNVRFGVGIASLDDGRTRLMVGLVERGIELEPMPASLDPGKRMRLRGRLLGGRKAPRIEVIDAKGRHSQVPSVVGDDGSVDATITCSGGKGRHKVEVLADGAHGPEIVANFPIYCGVSRPAEIDFTYERLADSVTVADIVQTNFSYLNEARGVRGLPALAWDGAAASVAEGHSRDMVASGFMGHVSPSTGDVTNRFARAKLEGSVIRENVARGYGPRGIHESLMNSPGHRVNILAADVTHVGIGVVFGEPETDAKGAPRPVFLTQNFYSKPGADVPRDLPREIRRQVDDQRKEAGLAALRWDGRASALAQQRADALANDKAAMPDEELADALFKLGFSAIERRQVETDNWRALSTLDLWSAPDGIRCGLGIAQLPEARGGGFILILLADKQR